MKKFSFGERGEEKQRDFSPFEKMFFLFLFFSLLAAFPSFSVESLLLCLIIIATMHVNFLLFSASEIVIARLNHTKMKFHFNIALFEWDDDDKKNFITFWIFSLSSWSLSDDTTRCFHVGVGGR